MRYLAFFILLTFCFSCNNQNKNTVSIGEGVSLSLAEMRSNSIENLHYELHFHIPNSKEAAIPAHEKLIFDFKGDMDLFLDFQAEPDYLMAILVNGTKINILFAEEHIRIPLNYLTEGENTIEISFRAGDLSLNRNKDFLYTLLVPDRARTLFPCFDQPDLKATYSLGLTVPNDWSVLASTAIDSIASGVDGTTYTFLPSPKMSSYLFSFVAGKFKENKQNTNSFPITFLYRETDSNKVAFNQASLYQLHVDAISFLESYTKTKFPFPKLDFACIPGFQYGGMEHVGAIQYRENALILDKSATNNQLLGRAKLIAHETAHMWFGDWVTMAWFNDVWMKEVFANFMADKIVNPAFPEVNHDLSFMVSHYPRAYAEDRTLGTNPIRQPLENLNNAGSLYGSIIYNKAPIMMRQLEHLMGKELFAEGLSQYIKTYANGNATWPDLIEILDIKVDMDLAQWSQVWVNSPSRPVFQENITYDDKDRISNFVLTQTAEDGSGLYWPQQFDITLVYPDEEKSFSLALTTKEETLEDLIGMPRPDVIRYNSNGLGYGVFPVSNDMGDHQKIADAVARGANYINLFENTVNGNLEATNTFRFMLAAMTKENNELLLGLLSDYSTHLFWHYLSEEQRAIVQDESSQMLWKELNRSHNPNKKKIVFSTFRSLAYTDNAIHQLYEIWKSPQKIKDLKLSNRDKTRIAMDLALYRHPEQEAILKAASEAISNPDEKERFQYLLPSLSSDLKVRAAFSASLQNADQREKEAWVATALRHLHHPLRSQEALSYLPMTLELLPEIQRTGDIFFPKRWLSSSVGQHTSKKAFDLVKTFVEEHPDLEPSLVSKLWQAADDLRRVQRITP
jgi:aminopeptidase N